MSDSKGAAIDKVLETMHEKVAFGWIKNDGKSHDRPSHANGDSCVQEAKQAILAILAQEVKPDKVDRFEVIDDTGRAYVKGSIYGSPVSVELSYQDDGRTLKVFVSDRKAGLV